MKSVDVSIRHPRYPVRFMIEDALVILVPILILVGGLWFYWDKLPHLR